MIWNPNKECMSRDEMSALQGKRLHKIVEYVYHNVPFYRNKLQELDIRPDDIQTIEDIKKLPFTTKKDLRDTSVCRPLRRARSSACTLHQALPAILPSLATPARTSACGASAWLAV